MKTEGKRDKAAPTPATAGGYPDLLGQVSGLLEQTRRASARSVNAIMTATYWLVGRHIVEFEQTGETRAEYGQILLERLSRDLSHRFGKGFGPVNLSQMRRFFLCWPAEKIFQTLSEKSETLSRKFPDGALAARFPLPWSAYVRLLSVKDDYARRFYEEEALRGGWSVRQLDRQIGSLFYERTALSRSKAKMLTGKFTHADAGQMHMYLNYAREHWTQPGENPPVGLILCAQKDDAVAKYALEGLPNKVMAAEYQTVLPDTRLLEDELRQTRRVVENQVRERGAVYVTGKRGSRT